LPSLIAGARKTAPNAPKAMLAIKKRFFIQESPVENVPRGQAGTPGVMEILSTAYAGPKPLFVGYTANIAHITNSIENCPF
jgi:hypothetical protein